MARHLGTGAARRITLAAQGLTTVRPGAATTARHLAATLDRLGVIQIDSVNVLTRAHLLTLYNRVGPFTAQTFTRVTEAAPRSYIEAWAHVASYVTPRTYHLLQWRAQAYRRKALDDPRHVAVRRPELIDAVLAAVTEHGQLTARQMVTHLSEPAHTDRTHWGWNWSDTKWAMEHLFLTQELAVARRTAQFERVFDLSSRVVPGSVVADRQESIEELVETAARALGVATRRCLADYFRLTLTDTATAVENLRRRGVLTAVEVEAWPGQEAYVHSAARCPRRVAASALLAPFDSLVFERSRLQALFHMDYRIGIYTPAHKRTHGYYALPVLLGEEIVARADVKADRKRGRLIVHGLYSQVGHESRETATACINLLQDLQQWLGLDGIDVGEITGDLAPFVTKVT